MSLSLPRRKREILAYITRYIESNSFAPTLTDIAKNFDINLPTAHEHLEYLHTHGLIFFEEGKSGKIVLPKKEEDERAGMNYNIGIPLVGCITAGAPIEAIEHKEEDIQVPHSMTYGRDCYILKVRGDSMIDDYILDGDLVVVEKSQSAHNGDTVVAMLEDGTATLKRFYKETSRVRLQPANPLYRPIYLDNVTIQGRVVGVIRKYS